MRTKLLMLVLGATALLGAPPSLNADTYPVFQTTRYFSADRKYFVELTPSRRATLFLNARRPRKVWTRALPELPGELLLTDDGRRVITIDRYYGNDAQANLPVVVVLNERGEELSSYRLGELANLPKVLRTVSTAHWYKGARLDSSGRSLIIDTVIAKRDPATCVPGMSMKDTDECFTPVPYERLRFDVATGKLESKERIAGGRTPRTVAAPERQLATPRTRPARARPTSSTAAAGG